MYAVEGAGPEALLGDKDAEDLGIEEHRTEQGETRKKKNKKHNTQVEKGYKRPIHTPHQEKHYHNTPEDHTRDDNDYKKNQGDRNRHRNRKKENGNEDRESGHLDNGRKNDTHTYYLYRDTTGQEDRMPRGRQGNQGEKEEDRDKAEGEDFKEQAVRAKYKSRGNYGQETPQEGGHSDNTQHRPNAEGRKRPNCCAFRIPSAS